MEGVQVSVYSDKGTRAVNEDAYGYRTEGERACFAVADGLGGHDAGEVASETAVRHILNHYMELETVSEERLIHLLSQANKAVMDRQQEYPGMHTTIVSALAEEGKFWYFYAGDSRCYYFKNGCIYTRSKDHSVPQMEVDMGEAKPEDIRFHPGRNRLLKVLGNGEELWIDRLDFPVVIEPGDAFLLCSDGFWEYVYETEMELDLVKSTDPGEWVDFMVKRLLLRPAGERDNFTVLAGWFL